LLTACRATTACRILLATSVFFLATCRASTACRILLASGAFLFAVWAVFVLSFS